MKSDLLRDVSNGLITLIRDDAAGDIDSVTYDSRKAHKGALFVAVPGFQTDGHNYVQSAYDNGCRHFIVAANRADQCPQLPASTVYETTDSRRALSLASSVCYGEITKKIPVIGVTGTNGKTSITYMIESVLKNAGYMPGVIGTINYRWDGVEMNAPNTTPESSDLHEICARMYADGVDVIVMEVSSHALTLGRVDDIHFSVALFTNLTQDHLDFHADFEAYYAAKKHLFTLLARSESKTGIKTALINTDDEYGARLFTDLSAQNMRPLSLSTRAGSMYHIIEDSISSRLDGLSYKLEIGSSQICELDLHVSALFNVYNSALSFGASHVLGVEEDDIINGLAAITHVPGRFDRVSSALGFHIIVDYAHSGDALEKLLSAAREINPKRVITVFGCGGDRDKKKRPLMGKTAVTNSDISIVTSDNPRTEKPETIIDDILAGIQPDDGEWTVIVDRREAIRYAVSIAEEGDLLVIAGKGHEDYQVVGTEKIHFDDKEIVQHCVLEREEA